ncbi:hypothetical protein [Pseudomonas sp. S9]|uniref:hypothetical protein n=1 Tax=Pseudomonas sp. S9 TaxID=686578 RepID=UPI0002E4251A|nr:hypothetical protein [Pseudomonas sp. S9]
MAGNKRAAKTARFFYARENAGQIIDAELMAKFRQHRVKLGVKLPIQHVWML